ncbi:Alpha/Beta hydrolase protein [Gongronella butleri]|nr:Alpha/Beta hydrolase protein [Gongronella butleri]
MSLPHATRVGIVRYILEQIGRRGQIMMKSSTAPHGSQWNWIEPIQAPKATVFGHWYIRDIYKQDDPQSYIQKTTSNADLVLLYIHGGGFRMGASTMYTDTFIRLLKRWEEKYHVQARICSMEYKFAPEWSIDQMLQACSDVYQYLLSLDVDPSKLIIGGDSAGGYLTAMLLNNIKTIGLPMPLGAIAVSPLVTHEMDTYSFTNYGAYDCIPDKLTGQDYTELFPQLKSYTSHEDATPFLHERFPLYIDCKDFPPMLVTYGLKERFSDHIQQFAHKLTKSNVPVEVLNEQNEVHVFNVTPFLASSKKIWGKHVDRMADWCMKIKLQ